MAQDPKDNPNGQPSDTGPEPDEVGFDDLSRRSHSSSGGEVNEREPSWRPGDDPEGGENSSADAGNGPEQPAHTAI